MATRQATPAAVQGGYLEPVSDAGPYTIAGIFGKAAPSPLVLAGGAGGNYLESGGYEFGVAPMSGVQTVDTGPGPMSPEAHIPHAKNLLRPMHSEALWVLLLAAVALGLFSVAGNARLGPVRFGGQIGK